MISDYHTHTYFSTDSEAKPIEHIRRAKECGMNEICFTDHLDLDYPKEDGKEMFKLDPVPYFKELNALRKKYDGEINVRIGLEMGLNPSIAADNNAFANAYPFDFIIGSSHIVNGIDPYYPEYWGDRSIKDSIMAYFEAVLKNVTTFDNYDVYGHLDYVRRYVPDKTYVYTDDEFYDITDMILKNIIAKGKGIELNTRGLSKGITYFVPTISLLKRYNDLGGEIITVGSDAHSTDKIGYAFKTARDILLNTGFKYVTGFEGRKPYFVEL